jgi:hypothetical protein
LLALGEAALEVDEDQLAYAAAGAGLPHAGPGAEPRAAALLLLRARSLADFAPQRAERCLTAAATVADRYHDEGLQAGLAAARGCGLRPDRSSMSDDAIVALIAEERAAIDYPDKPELFDSSLFAALGQCPCPACQRERARRRGGGSVPDDWDLAPLVDPADDGAELDRAGADQVDLFSLDDDEDDDDDLDLDLGGDLALGGAMDSFMKMLAAQGQLGAVLESSGLPAPVAELFEQAIRRHGTVDVARLYEVDPMLAARISIAMEAIEEPAPPGPAPTRPRSSRSRSKSKRRRRSRASRKGRS